MSIMNNQVTAPLREPSFKITKPASPKRTPAQVRHTLRNKRCKTLINKSDQLSKLGVRVYVVAEVNGRYHVYSSESSATWPPTEASLVGVCFLIRHGSLLIHYRRETTRCRLDTNLKITRLVVTFMRKNGQCRRRRNATHLVRNSKPIVVL